MKSWSESLLDIGDESIDEELLREKVKTACEQYELELLNLYWKDEGKCAVVHVKDIKDVTNGKLFTPVSDYKNGIFGFLNVIVIDDLEYIKEKLKIGEIREVKLNI